MSDYPAIDPATVAPLKNGKPDFYNHMPTRFVPRDESQARGWTYFYLGEACRYGHIAPRFTSNPRMCIDCHRVRDGKLPIGAKGDKEYTKPVKQYKQPERPIGGLLVTPSPLEPDSLEKKFLVEYAKHRSFAKAAAECGRHEAEFLGRLSYSKVFRDAVNQLEADNGLARTPSLTEDFEWTDDKRVTLIRVYINTGKLIDAQKSIGVTNFHFQQELQDNSEFRNAMDRATEMANGLIEHIGIGFAIDGDSRLLQKVMAAKNPDYSDRVRVDMNVTAKLTHEQLIARLSQEFRALGIEPRVSESATDAEFVELEQGTTTTPVRDDSSPKKESVSESNFDLV